MHASCRRVGSSRVRRGARVLPNGPAVRATSMATTSAVVSPHPALKTVAEIACAVVSRGTENPRRRLRKRASSTSRARAPLQRPLRLALARAVIRAAVHLEPRRWVVEAVSHAVGGVVDDRLRECSSVM